MTFALRSHGHSARFAVHAFALVAATALSALTGCGSSAGDSSQQTQQAASLSGACDKEGFDTCIDNSGGGGCAKWCIGDCVSAVAACARSGGGKACSNRCDALQCVPQEIWTTVNTSECGIPYGGTEDNDSTIGQAKATCTQECDGTVDHCSIWHDSIGRAQCTIGVPLDAAGNPY